jgi:PAS domain S-box-containing protein
MEEEIRVLYVDDEPALLEITRAFLEEHGDFRVATFASAVEALNSLDIHTFDLIISDYQMPGMDGITFLKEIRHRFGTLPFILFTGRGREEIVIEAINNGADFYLQKGGDPASQFAELAHKIRQAVARKRGEDKLRSAYEQITASEEELRSNLEEIAKAETDREKSERNFKDLVDNAPDAIYTQVDERFLYLNNAAVRLFGATSAEELLEKSVWDRIHPSFHEPVRQRLKSLTVDRTAVGQRDEVYVRLDGTTVDVEVTAVPYSEEGRRGALVMLRDITERKRSENELRAAYEQIAGAEKELREQYDKLALAQQKLTDSRQLLAEIASSVPGVVYQFYARPDGSMGVYFTSSRVTEIFGISADAVQNFEQFTDGVDLRDRDAFLHSIRGAVSSGLPWDFEGRFNRQDGEQIWFQGLSRPVKKGTELVYNGVLLDITRRKKAEEQLRESEDKYRSLVEKANEAITILQDGITVYANPRMADLVGIPAGDLLGTVFLDTIWPDDRELLHTRYRKRCAGEEVPDTYDFRMTGPDGKPRWIHLSIAVIQWQGRLATLNLMSDITERKQAEEALRASEKNYRNLVENSLSIIYVLLPDGTLTFVSPSWKTVLGHEPDEVIGHNFRLFVHEDDIPRCEEFLKMVFRTGTMQTSSADYRIRHRDGSIHWHRSSVVPVFDDRGNLVSLVGNAVDLTDRKHAEEALEESRAELSAILHGSPVLQFVIGRDHRILAWNKALEEYSGIPATEVIGTDQHWRAFYPQQRPVLADLIVDNNTDGLFKWYGGKLRASRYVEGAYEALDFFPSMGAAGLWLAFTAAPVRNPEGTITGAVETLEDVTERVTATEALRLSEEMYRHILENMQDAYIRTENGLVTMVNPSAARMYGYDSAEEMLGIPATALYTSGERERDMALANVQDAGIIDFIGEAPRKDGTTFAASLNIQFLRDREGRVTGAEAIVRDVSERRLMEQAIREANRKLGLLNSITRHDIMNQLTMLQGFTRLAVTKERDPVIAGYLSKIDEGIGTIHRQIEFMKQYQELGVHSPGWFRLDGIIAKVGGKGVVFSAGNIEIFADPMLEKVFFNLFDNARRHGERVTEIRVRCEQPDDGLVIIVEDNGVGIPAEEKERIFEKGFGKNSGLGLFLAREILSITGLTIRECGTPGSGALFEIAVPKGAFRPA